jgi:hypothetical protein
MNNGQTRRQHHSRREAFSMNEEEYLEQRLEKEIQWYSKKSRHNKRWFNILRLIEMVSAALIPFLSGSVEKVSYFPWIIGFLGVLIAVSAATGSLFKFQENWIQYRTTSEQLKHEKYLYLTETESYHNNDEKFMTLVERVESLISKENSLWAKHTKKTKADVPKGATE